MATEIEMKAWVRDPTAVREAIERLCSFERSYIKKDIYLHGPTGRPEESWAHWSREKSSGPPPRPRDFRLRMEDGSATCTFKDRNLDRGLEVNREVEFTVSDGRLFLELAARLGCRVFSCKVKEGRRYTRAGDGDRERKLVAELSHIPGLGDFIEVEFVFDSDKPSAEDTEDTYAAIRTFLDRIGIEESDIESRPYAKLLDEQGSKQCGEIAELAGLELGEPR